MPPPLLNSGPEHSLNTLFPGRLEQCCDVFSLLSHLSLCLLPPFPTYLYSPVSLLGHLAGLLDCSVKVKLMPCGFWSSLLPLPFVSLFIINFITYGFEGTGLHPVEETKDERGW